MYLHCKKRKKNVQGFELRCKEDPDLAGSPVLSACTTWLRHEPRTRVTFRIPTGPNSPPSRSLFSDKNYAKHIHSFGFASKHTGKRKIKNSKTVKLMWVIYFWSDTSKMLRFPLWHMKRDHISRAREPLRAGCYRRGEWR